MKKKFFGLLLAIAAFACGAQAQNSNTNSKPQESDNRKAAFGVSLGFTENRVDLYYTPSGVAYPLEQGNYSFYARGFRLADVVEFYLDRRFSLRAMPGISLFGSSWEPGAIAVPVPPLVDYRVESVLGELPIDVKYHPFRVGSVQPYVTSGLSYGFDFTSLRRNSGNESIMRLNPNDLRFTCGLGFDCYTRYLKVGVEMKAGFGLLSPNTSGSFSNDFYFHSGPAFSFGINIQA